jgi:hypothetical protein
MQHNYISDRYTNYSSSYICILLDCSGMNVTIKILFKKSGTILLNAWSWRSESGSMKGWTHYLKSKILFTFFWFYSMLRIQPLIIFNVWMKVHVSFIHCFHFYVGCAATKLLHIHPLQTHVLWCSFFILHDAFHNLF